MYSSLALQVGAMPAPKPTGPRLTCLLVDDSRFDRQRVRYVADRSGLRVDFLEATTIREAREILESRAIDFILLDNFLPDGQGLGLAAELTDRGLPVIMLSGQDENGLSEAAIWAGLNDFVQKDALDPTKFGIVVRKVMAACGPKPEESQTRPVDLAVTDAIRDFSRDCVYQLHRPVSRLQAVLSEVKAGSPNLADQRARIAEMEELCTTLSEFLEVMSAATATPA